MVFCSVLIINLRALMNPQLNTRRSLLILLARVSHAPQRSFNSMSKPGKRQVIYLISISSNVGSIISWVFTFAFSTSLSSWKWKWITSTHLSSTGFTSTSLIYFHFSPYASRSVLYIAQSLLWLLLSSKMKSFGFWWCAHMFEPGTVLLV